MDAKRYLRQRKTGDPLMHRTLCRLAIALPLAAAALPAFAASTSMMVSDCWIRSMPGDTPSGGYFKLMNMSDKPVDLVGVSTDAFGMSMLHETQSSGSTSKMVMVDKASVPANGTLAFAPGGYHVMFEKAKKPLTVGSSIPVTFRFSDGESVEAQCAVKNAAGK
ncbi:copper chaperone PCu(A)C [Burkholderia anthina]|nr:copper chaperone PCu(A)C [Burkholderia anthina]